MQTGEVDPCNFKGSVDMHIHRNHCPPRAFYIALKLGKSQISGTVIVRLPRIKDLPVMYVKHQAPRPPLNLFGERHRVKASRRRSASNVLKGGWCREFCGIYGQTGVCEWRITVRHNSTGSEIPLINLGLTVHQRQSKVRPEGWDSRSGSTDGSYLLSTQYSKLAFLVRTGVVKVRY